MGCAGELERTTLESARHFHGQTGFLLFLICLIFYFLFFIFLYETLMSSSRRTLECKTSLRCYFSDRFRLTTADFFRELTLSQAGLLKPPLHYVVVTVYRQEGCNDYVNNRIWVNILNYVKCGLGVRVNALASRTGRPPSKTPGLIS